MNETREETKNIYKVPEIDIARKANTLAERFLNTLPLFILAMAMTIAVAHDMLA